MLHKSHLLSLFLIVFLASTAFFTFVAVKITYELFLIFVAIVLAFFWKVRPVRYVAMFCAVVLLSAWRFAAVSNNGAISAGSVKGYVCEESVVSGSSQRFVLCAGNNYQSRVGVTTNQFPRYNFGEGIVITGELENVRSSDYYQENPGYFLANRITYSAFYPEVGPSAYQPSFFQGKYIFVRTRLIQVRQAYELAIAQVLPEPESGLLAGILLGSRSDLSQEAKELLIRVGIIHIIALSGYNITVIAGAFSKVFKYISAKTAPYLALSGIWLFVAATGASASVVRAAIMGSVLILAQILGRKTKPYIAVLLAASLMVFLNPYILIYDIGFQLSFAAVLGMLFLSPPLSRFFAWAGNLVAETIGTTLAAQLFTLPLISYYFGRISLISLTANALVLPFIPMIMLIGFGLSSLSFASLWLAQNLAVLAWIPLAYIFRVSEYLGSWRLAEVNYGISVTTLVALYILLLETSLIMGKLGGAVEKADR